MSLSKVNLIQNTAISFACVEDKFDNFKSLNSLLSKKFKVDFNENVTLYTIRHFNDTATQTVEQGKSDFETSQIRKQCK
jgi:aspartate kinase